MWRRAGSVDTLFEMSTPRGTVAVYEDADELALATANLVAEKARAAVLSRGRFSIALAGGGTPSLAYRLLAGPPFRATVPWDRVFVFFGDERCVPPDDPRSNEHMAREAFLDAVGLPSDHIHPMRCVDSAGEAASAYESSLRAFFAPPAPGLDLALLGLGDNGHTASLFPHASALQEKERWVTEAFVDARAGAGTTAAGEDMWRVTLTAPFLSAASTIVFLVSGPGKAAVAKEVLEGPLEPDRLPAQLIRPASGDLRWHLDRAAAAQLTRRNP
jgi:6-phosphogluconolactonase